jgi:hypothetical protein
LVDLSKRLAPLETIKMANAAEHLLIEVRDRHIRCGLTEGHREGVAAFLEKREPRFRGR